MQSSECVTIYPLKWYDMQMFLDKLLPVAGGGVGLLRKRGVKWRSVKSSNRSIQVVVMFVTLSLNICLDMLRSSLALTVS